MRRFPPSSLAALAVAVVALAPAACRKELPPYTGPRAPESFNACALFPASEAKAELRGLEIGQVSGPLDVASGKKFARCAYGFGPQANVVASLELRRHEHPEEIHAGIEASRPLLDRLAKGDVVDVDGIGDVGIWAGGELRLLKIGWRDLEILVTVHPRAEDGFQRALAERIARRAIYRLEEQPVPEELRLEPLTVTLATPVEPQPEN